MYIDIYGRMRSDELYHHGIKGMHWGIRRFQPYPSGHTGGKYVGKASSYANSIHAKASSKEPTITRNVKTVAKMSGFNMYGLEHRLKTKESIKRKIETDSLEKNIGLDEASNDLKDAVRYTAITDDNHFVSAYKKFKQGMKRKGYEEVRCKNYFNLYREGKVKHKSVQSVFEDEDGYVFEVQFQTPASQKAKDLKLPIYEERRRPGLSEARQKELEQKMIDLAEKVPYPKEIDTIKTYDALKKLHK